MEGEKRLSLTEYERLTRPTEARLSLEEVKRAIEERPELCEMLVHIVKLCVLKGNWSNSYWLHLIRKARRQASKEKGQLQSNVIPNAIVNLRILRDETQAEFAKHIQSTQSQLCKWETGEHAPTYKPLVRLLGLALSTPGALDIAHVFNCELGRDKLEP